MKTKADLWDYIMLLRPTLMMPVWMFLFYGHYAAKFRGSLHGFDLPFCGRFWLAMLSLTLISATAYIVNQIFDIETDRINKKLFLLPEGIITVRSAWLYTAALSVVGLAIAFYMGREPFILLTVIWITGFLYSVPPFRFKGRPVIDMVWNGLGYGFLTFLLGYWSFSQRIDRAALISSIPYILAVFGVYAETTIADIEGDRRDGAITIGVLLGEKATAVVGAVLMLASAVTALILKDIMAFIPAAVTAIVFIYTPFVPKERFLKSVKFAFRLSGAIYAVNIGVHYPIYVLIGVVVYAGMKVYYKNRFGLNYPSLNED